MADIRYRILGPLEAWDGRGWVAPTAPKQRLLLGVLLCHANRVVSADRLRDELWGADLPATARQLLPGYVFQLRRLLADREGHRLVTRPGGYRLVARPGELDADRFTALVREGRRALWEQSFEAAEERFSEALALWRGPALADVASTPATDAERTRLADHWLVAAEGRLQAELSRGRHREVLPDLAGLAAEHPLQEEIHRCLMLALHRSGHPAEALEVYRSLRQRLVDELGIEPGPPVQELHRQILSADSAPAPVAGPAGDTGPPATAVAGDPVPPWQLPPDPAAFTGRDRELARAEQLLAGGATGPAIVAIYGPAGVGKSTMALHLAHRVAERYPDGVRYADLHGATVALAPLAPHAVLVRFLGALGVPAGAVPADPDGAGAMFRSRLASRRILLLLDNAAGVGQVRPLLPAGPGCAVLVTSREMLATLDRADHLDLPVLPADQATALLAALAGHQRVRAEPEAAATLARQGGYLPLALRIAGARLAARPAWPVRALADRLADERRRLDELARADLAVRTSFRASYQALAGSDDPADQAAAQTFRRLGLLDGPEASPELAAVLAGGPLPVAAAALERLVDSQLVTSPVPGRYRLHDLLRLFARELAAEQEPPAGRQVAVARVLRWYVATARRAVGWLAPGEPRAQGPQAGARPFGSREDARGWLDAERVNLPAVARQAAADPGTAALAVQLGWALFRYLDTYGHWHELVELNQAALAGADRIGDPVGRAQAHNDLGAAWTRLRRAELARTHLRDSLAIRRELGDRSGLSATLNNLGILYRQRRQLTDAVNCFEESLALRRELGDRRGEARTLDNLGQVWLELGQYQQTIACQEQSLAIARQLPDRQLAGLVLGNLADTCARAGQPPRALALAEECLEICRALGNRPGEALAYAAAGRARHALGHRERARQHWLAALALLEPAGSPYADEIRELLDGSGALDGSGPVAAEARL